MESALYIVPTPIGNLSDITERARAVLGAVTLIAAEDTRHSSILLNHLGLAGRRLISCHNYNEAERADLIAREIEDGGSVALISDAGSPLINDPGYKVVADLAARGIRIVPLPGPCALITALEAAALPTDRFTFAGFLPPRGKDKREAIAALAHCDCTTIYYEAPHRVLETLEMMAEAIPDRALAICRELTKTYEQVIRLTAAAAPAYFKDHPEAVRGEFVLVVGPAPAEEDRALPEALTAALRILLPTTPVKAAAEALAQVSGYSRNEIYTAALSLKKELTAES